MAFLELADTPAGFRADFEIGDDSYTVPVVFPGNVLHSVTVRTESGSGTVAVRLLDRLRMDALDGAAESVALNGTTTLDLLVSLGSSRVFPRVVAGRYRLQVQLSGSNTDVFGTLELHAEPFTWS